MELNWKTSTDHKFYKLKRAPWTHFCDTPCWDNFIFRRLGVQFGSEAWCKDLTACNGFSSSAFPVCNQRPVFLGDSLIWACYCRHLKKFFICSEYHNRKAKWAFKAMRWWASLLSKYQQSRGFHLVKIGIWRIWTTEKKKSI